jgi:hypothetical protein
MRWNLTGLTGFTGWKSGFTFDLFPVAHAVGQPRPQQPGVV